MNLSISTPNKADAFFTNVESTNDFLVTHPQPRSRELTRQEAQGNRNGRDDTDGRY